jgi:uncharacterized OsmC-like protein
MDATELRARQAPLKEQYRTDPESALIPLGARADWRGSGVTTSVDTWSGRTRAGLHEATGGEGDDACSADMLLEAVVACAGVTMRAVATAMGLVITAADLTAEAEFDARGTLGIDRAAPVGISGLTVTATLTTRATDEELARLALATERYCVVGQSLAHPPSIRIRRRSAQ